MVVLNLGHINDNKYIFELPIYPCSPKLIEFINEYIVYDWNPALGLCDIPGYMLYRWDNNFIFYYQIIWIFIFSLIFNLWESNLKYRVVQFSFDIM